MTWAEVDTEARFWTIPAARTKGGQAHRVPLTDAMLAVLEPMRAMGLDYVFEGQKRHQPLSNMSMVISFAGCGRAG